MSQTRLLNAEQVARTVRRLAYGILEHNRGSDNAVLIGIRDRGSRLAEILTAELVRIEGRPVRCASIDVVPFRDDRPEGQNPPSVLDGPDLEDRDVILVDDVLFTGRTARAALDAVVRLGRPRSIQLAVLVDRGHREYPIQADYVGRAMPTKHRERVVVNLEEDFSVDVVE